ncbi:hypothetical protein [Photobacterium toruni]|uniref:hypothetical protein n=1 Tax=Photobacterium toruni TaxID=1935446 RepID=UPI00210FF9EA|nr:hypothetical protein [Photobacterium toruni]
MNSSINTNLSDVELAKRLKELKGITTSDSAFNKILKELIPEEKIDTVHRIIRGLSQEDEFALLCKMMQCCSSITPLEQTPLLDSDEKTPDFQVTFHPASFFSNMPPHKDFAYKCMVEVKSTDKLRFKTSRADVNRRKAYADRFNLPLLYAVRFLVAEQLAFWVIVTAEQLLDKNTLTSNDFVPSLNSFIFDNYTVMLNPSYTVVRHYSKSQIGIGEIHQELGALKKVTICDDNGIIYTLENNDALLFSMLFSIYETYGTYVETYKDESIVYSHFSIHQFRTIADIVFGISNIITDEYGEKAYDPTRAIASMDSKDESAPLLHRSTLESMLKRINQNCSNFFFYGMLGDEVQHSQKIHSLFPKHIMKESNAYT